MDKPKIFSNFELNPATREFLIPHVDLTVCTQKLTANEFAQKARYADGLMVTNMPVGAALLDICTKVKMVASFGVGYNNLDTAEMKKKGVIGSNTPDVLNGSVAELVMALMLSTARRVAELDRYMRNKHWSAEDNTNLFGLPVTGRDLGIIGMGRIGQTVAKIAKLGFHMKVSYSARSRKMSFEKEYGVAYLPMDELLKQSDFVVIMTPLTPSTTHMLGKKEFSMMKSSSILINASRGAVIDESALIEALENKLIAGAGLDVYEREPIAPDNKLLTLDNTTLTPHIGSAVLHTRMAMEMLVAENIADWVNGKTPRTLIPELDVNRPVLKLPHTIF